MSPFAWKQIHKEHSLGVEAGERGGWGQFRGVTSDNSMGPQALVAGARLEAQGRNGRLRTLYTDYPLVTGREIEQDHLPGRTVPRAGIRVQ